jgi:hypothetical protein
MAESLADEKVIASPGWFNGGGFAMDNLASN